MDRGAWQTTVHGVAKSRMQLHACTQGVLDLFRKLDGHTMFGQLPCPTLFDPIDGSPPGSPVPGILQARTLEWVAIAFSNA